MDNLESAICEVQEEIVQIRLARDGLDRILEPLETVWLMLEGRPSRAHRHRCPHCGAYAVCPLA